MARARLAASVGPRGHVWGGSRPVGYVLPLSSTFFLYDLFPTYFPALLMCPPALLLSTCSLQFSGSRCPPPALPASLYPCGIPPLILFSLPRYGRLSPSSLLPAAAPSPPCLHLLLSHPLRSSQFLRNFGENEEASLWRVGGARGRTLEQSVFSRWHCWATFACESF